ncbi:MAG: radical SAM protein [Candidatus Ozemobacteraceae bacterium]
MNTGKILLVSPPLLWEDKLRLSFQPPLNLLYLFSYLRHHGFDVDLLDPVPLGFSLDETVTRLTSLNPAFVGVPLYYASLAQAHELVARIKQQLPQLRTIAGGPCLTMEPERMMREGSFDYGIIGEGEETLAALLSGAPPALIPGLTFRQENAFVVNPLRPPIANLDALPFLDFSVLDNEYYFRHQERANVPRTLFLNSSRGCSFRCTYCCTPLLWPGRIRRYSPRRLVDEITFQRERFPGADIGFCDDSFFSDREWLMEFIRLITPLHINYQCIGRADHLTAPMIKLLVESGLNYIAFGVETGNSSRQARLKKNLDLTALVRNMKELAQYDVKTKCFFMLGFPDETLEEMAETINLAATLKKNGMTFFSIFPVTVYPGTELAKQFMNQPFKSGLDAHLPEIIRDGLGIGEQSAGLLDTPFNSVLSQRQMVKLVTFAYQKVECAELISLNDIKQVILT